MHLAASSLAPSEQEVDVLVIGVASDDEMTGPLADLDRLTGGIVRRLREHKEFEGNEGESIRFPLPPAALARWAILVGLGKRSAVNAVRVQWAASIATRQIATKADRKAAYYFAPGLAAAGICGAFIGSEGQDLYRKTKNTYPLAEIRWHGASEADLAEGRQMGESINLTRRLVNQPPNILFPQSFAEQAIETAEAVGLGVEVWDEGRLHLEGCRAMLAVGQGSLHPPRLVLLKYVGTDPNTPPIALVGKGVTFDSGGYSIKPTDGMKDMKCDMAGAATVLGAMRAIALRKPKVNVLGVLGLVENLVSGNAYKLGDVIKARSGKTIEVLNTDAEGRIVLADALDVACTKGATKLVDLATLTGACVVALGNEVAGLMTNDAAWGGKVKEAAKRCGEYVWELPMHSEFGDQIRSQVADIKNVGNGRWGGAITAAKFLEEFVRERPWVHLDIAGPAFAESPKAWIDAGGSGFGVRTLVDLIEHA